MDISIEETHKINAIFTFASSNVRIRVQFRWNIETKNSFDSYFPREDIWGLNHIMVTHIALLRRTISIDFSFEANKKLEQIIMASKIYLKYWKLSIYRRLSKRCDVVLKVIFLWMCKNGFISMRTGIRLTLIQWSTW